MTNFPAWLKKRYPASMNVALTGELLDRLNLHTVCQNAICPNLGDCFARKIATFMVLGNNCTRSCGFCAVGQGAPGRPDRQEPQRIAEAVAQLGLRHVVITSVTRDDLDDGGAHHFVGCIDAVRKKDPTVVIEVLTPDFKGKIKSIDIVAAAKPDIFNHNLETVPRLYPAVRPRAHYQRSLELLKQVKNRDSSIYTKSGLMVGLGETYIEMKGVLRDLRNVGCDIVTIGQYLRPSPKHMEVKEFVHPDIFDNYRFLAEGMGFMHAASGPFVRSSYNARDFSARYLKKK